MKNVHLLITIILWLFSNLLVAQTKMDAVWVQKDLNLGLTVYLQKIENDGEIILHQGCNEWVMLENGAIVLKDNHEYGLTVYHQNIENDSRIILHKGYNYWKLLPNGAIVLKNDPKFGLTVLNQNIKENSVIILHERYNKWKENFLREGFKSSSWMSDVKDNINLKDLTIPGSHDAGSDYGCPDYSFSKYAKCQDMTISQQLYAGIRYLDIRLKYNQDEDKMRIQHGKCYQRDHFDDVLSDIKAFFSNHPSETIIMRLKHEDDETDSATFATKFEDYVSEYSSMIYKGTDLPNLGKVRGKIVIVRFTGKIHGFHAHSNINAPGGGYTIDKNNTKYQRWYDSWIRMIACNNLSSPRSKLWLNPFNGNGLLLRGVNTDDGFTTTVKSGFGQLFNFTKATVIKYDTPRDVANYMMPKLSIDLNKNGYKRGCFGVVALDFPTKEVIKQLINTNNIPKNRKRNY